MTKFSATKLLRLALTGSHIPYCPHVNDKTPGYECLCWRFEVRKWDAQAKLTSKARIRKARPQKIHLSNYKCSTKSPATLSLILNDVTCKQCLRFANRPLKPITNPKISKNKKKMNGSSSNIVSFITTN